MNFNGRNALSDFEKDDTNIHLFEMACHKQEHHCTNIVVKFYSEVNI